jgi:Zn-dependent metalloprotease
MQIIKLHVDSLDPTARVSQPGDAEALRIPKGLVMAARSPTGEEMSIEGGQHLKSRNDETVARTYLDAILTERSGELFALTAPDRPEMVPDLRLTEVQDSPLTPTRVLKFVQTSKSVPIFGTAAFVEIDGVDRRLVSTDATLTDTPDISAVATLGPAEALAAIENQDGKPLPAEDAAQLPAAKLNFFADPAANKWRLVYYFQSVPIVPPEQRGEHTGHGLGRSPRDDFRHYDYLVDAHSGEIAYYFSSQPCLDVPVHCRGVDEFGQTQDFFGLAAGGQFRLSDPLRSIETFDHGGNDIQATTLPTTPITHSATDFAKTNTAGVSAHFFATKVFDFYNDVLKRNGVDDKGMKLVSIVNATYARHEPPPNWRNAVWWNNRMWYGRVQNGSGGFNSYARYFDVIAHELTHGVTETTSNLVYRDLPGALNESFSDIFAVIINNWYPGEPNPVTGWNWEIGAGLGSGGGPLRDLRDPARSGQPDHMSAYVPMTADNGGVHHYSGIHNKAAYHVLTEVDANGAEVFGPQETALLYYLTLTRLTRLSDFSDCLRVLKSVIGTLHAGDSAAVQAKRQTLTDAYQKVGII